MTALFESSVFWTIYGFSLIPFSMQVSQEIQHAYLSYVWSIHWLQWYAVHYIVNHPFCSDVMIKFRYKFFSLHSALQIIEAVPYISHLRLVKGFFFFFYKIISLIYLIALHGYHSFTINILKSSVQYNSITTAVPIMLS